jgi:Calcineurin-like phosphoesterase
LHPQIFPSPLNLNAMTLTAEQQLKITEIETLLAQNPTAASILSDFGPYLQNCECQLINFMVEQGAWQGAAPLLPPNFKPVDNGIDFGLFLYWFKNPGYIDNLAISLLVFALDFKLKLPPSLMTYQNYEVLNTTTNPLVYVDGTVVNRNTWDTYDQGWFAAFINMFQSLLYNTWYNGGNFPMPQQPTPVPLSGATANTVNIALVGDWGTGDGPAKAVMNKITSLNPDYIIHLGDVYYGGTPAATDPSSKHYYSLNEEVENFLNGWPKGFEGKSFTLNSNHEMYSGANGLFNDILLPPSSPFNAQQGMSCFVLQFGGWTILGLDSAYHSFVTTAFMDGNLGPADGAQVKWITSLGLNPATTIVLTHHTGVAYDASAPCNLWTQLRAALGGKDPYAWYWGHAHNGIVYSNPVKIPYDKPVFTGNSYARCAGHGALPYGVSTDLKKHTHNVLWQASTLQPGSSTLLCNGFVMLTLQTSNNQVVTITENFYDTSPTQAQPTWSKVIFQG